MSNATRGKIAEFIVAHAVGIKGHEVRDEWAPYDLETDESIKIEVKSSAYIQSWHQTKLSSILFTVPPTRKWHPTTNLLTDYPIRTADVYVFALLDHHVKATIDPLNIQQWTFFALPSFKLNERKRSQKSITLKSLQALAGEGLRYDSLGIAVRSALKLQKENRST